MSQREHLESDLGTAAFLHMRPPTLRAWRRQARIPYVRLQSRAVRYRREDLEALVASSVVPARRAEEEKR